MTEILTVSIACGSDTEARTIAKALVEARLAACVQSHAVTSTYRWQGTIETAPEIMLTVKTRLDRLPALEARVRELHSYDVPEIVAQAVLWASDAYVQWLNESLAPDE